MTTLINRNGVKITVETNQNVTITEKQIIIDLVNTLPSTKAFPFDLDKKKKTNKTRSKYMTKTFAKKINATPASYSKNLVNKAKLKLT